ncbi:IpaB/EvcA family protein, partial [Streptococcus thermophilus]|nr:IpaB/EvcA family protein [Streptococcus thermophilus]
MRNCGKQRKRLMTEIKLNQTVTDLLSTANSLYPG